jgi:5-methylcytosine-specific restriction endonuclease McrA
MSFYVYFVQAKGLSMSLTESKKIKHREASKKSYYKNLLANREKGRARAYKYRKTTKGKATLEEYKQRDYVKKAARDYSHQYRVSHKEEVKKSYASWYSRSGKKYFSIANQIRRARESRTKNTLTVKEWEILLEWYNHSCAYCGKHKSSFNGVLHREHVIPVSRGGETSKDNIVPACGFCNSKKGARTPEEAHMVLTK